MLALICSRDWEWILFFTLSNRITMLVNFAETSTTDIIKFTLTHSFVFSNRKGKNMWDHSCQQKGCPREMMMVSFLNMNTTYSILSHITKCTCVRIDDRWRTHIDEPDNWILHLFGTCLLYNVPFIMVPGRKRTLSSEEMAVFYKHFLDTNITRHTSYNRWD